METANWIYTNAKEHMENDHIYWFSKIDYISKVDGINVLAFIIVKINKIYFTIVHDTCTIVKLFGYIFNLESFNLKSIKNFVLKTVKVMESLEFDELTGVFKSNIIPSTNNYPLFFDVFGLKFIEKDECIECKKNTICKLTCKHFCCLKCFSSKYENDKNCTICGKKIIKRLERPIDFYSLDPIELNCLKEFNNTNKNIKSKYSDESDEENKEWEEDEEWEDEEDEDEEDEDDEDEDEDEYLEEGDNVHN